MEAKAIGKKGTLSLSQRAVRGKLSYGPEDKDRESVSVDVSNIPGLMQRARQAASNLAHCQKRVSLLANQPDHDDYDVWSPGNVSNKGRRYALFSLKDHQH